MPKITVCIDEATRGVTGVLVDGVRSEDYEVATNQRRPTPSTAVVLEFCPKAATGADKRLDGALEACVQPRVLAVVPWRNACVPPGCAYAESAAYVLPASVQPELHSFFPMNWRYASGFAMVEIEPVVDDTTNASLSAEFFMTRQFQERRKVLAATLRGSNGHGSMPGFILPETSKHLAAYAHAGTAKDPLLAQFRPDFVKTHKLKLQPNDYIAFCTSTWSNVSKETKAMAGHADAMRHYYIVVKWGLPLESVDQLKMLLYCNPNSDSWAKLVSRKPFERAAETARAVRAKFLADALAIAGLQPRKSNPHVTDTMADVFDTSPVEVAADSLGITFYSGCTPTSRAVRGLVTELSPERDAGLIWLHGAPSEKVGGEPWKQKASVDSVPVFAGAKATAKTLESYASAGWNKDFGYARIDPIIFV